MINNTINNTKIYKRKIMENLTEREIEDFIDENGYYLEDGTKYSGCCGAYVDDDIMICSDCREHI